jgi:hypothetical protein
MPVRRSLSEGGHKAGHDEAPYSCFHQTVKLPIRIQTQTFEYKLRIDEAVVWSGRCPL